MRIFFSKVRHVRYGDPSDVRKYETWMMCESCNIWVHQSCGLDHGIEDVLAALDSHAISQLPRQSLCHHEHFIV